MAGNWGNIAEAAVNGYLRGRQIVRSDEEYESDKKFKSRVRASQTRKLDREDAVERDLAGASQRQAVTERVAKPDYMDNRDVGQPGEAPMTASTPAAAGSALAGGIASAAGGGEAASRAAAAQNLATSQDASAEMANRAALASQQAGVTNQDVAAEGVAAPVDAAVTPPPAAAAPLAPVGVQSFEVGGKTYANRAAAQAAADSANAPDATVGRMADAYMRNGMPTEALALQQKQSQMQKAAEEMKEKGVFEGMRQFRLGDKTAAVATLKKSGLFKVGDGPVTMTPTETDVPGAGKIRTFDLTFPMVGEDGKTTPFTINSHQASMALMPYDKALELGRKGVATDASIDAKKDSLDIARQRLELTGAMNEARIAKLQAGGGGGKGGGSSDRETRLTVQSAATAINREISETNKAISDRVKDLPRASQAADPLLQSLYKQQSSLGAQRDAVQEQLVNLVEKKVGPEGTAGIRKQKGDASPPKDKSGAVKVSTRGEYDALPSGAVYIHPKTGEKLVKK
jgi:hypothetical protein